MRTITWLQISDFHLRDSQAWEQDVVLSSMCRDIAHRRRDVGPIDFVLATGDVAFAGKKQEYERASVFFDELCKVAGIERERIFCVPGNHDVDRDRNKMCFAGARHMLQSQNEIDLFLGSPDEVATLLQRQEHYQRFQEFYLARQDRVWTPDRLAYVASVSVEDLRIAIVGLNTAWLAEGGLSDHGRLLAGERQVIEALRIANIGSPHLVIAMGHHPFHLLNEFDRRPVQRRIEEACQFFHCGHLHDPEAHAAVRAGTHCLTVAAGASFESRHARNSYSLVRLDIMRAIRTVKTIHYKPSDGAFSYEFEESFPFVINAFIPCSTGALGKSIESYHSALSPVAFYMASLLLEAQAEVPIPVGKSYAFGSLELLEDQPDCELKAATIAFMAVRNPLRLMAATTSLDDFLARYGEEVRRFGTILNSLSANHKEIGEKLSGREADARALATAEPVQPFEHTLALLKELAAGQEWELLQEQAERNLGSTEKTVAIEARRMLALSLAQSGNRAHKEQAAALYRSLVDEGIANAVDVAALAYLLLGFGDHEGAKMAVFYGCEFFPDAADGYLDIGYAIIEATGDRSLRDELIARRTGRRKS